MAPDRFALKRARAARLPVQVETCAIIGAVGE